MSSSRFAIVLTILFGLNLAGEGDCQNGADSRTERDRIKIGKIFVIANETSSFEVILKALPFKAGQVIEHARLQQARMNLVGLGLFVVDRKSGIWPSVTAVAANADDDSDRERKDILVRVQERASLKIFPKGQQHDFGKVLPILGSANCSFPIFNKTNAPITITKIKTCRCSGSCVHTAEVTKKVFQPNEKGELRIVLDTRRFLGLKRSAVYLDIETGDGRRTYVFTVMANSTNDLNTMDHP